jgi:CHAT domain-containing protein/tetratricopeptide (TPR) repeat protein
LKKSWLGTLLCVWVILHPLPTWSESGACSFELQKSIMNLRPVLQPDSELAGNLERAYRQRLLPGQDAAAEVLLRRTYNLALDRHNSCAQGLAAFGLGQVLFDRNFPEAESWYQRAESAFSDLHAGLPLGRTHYELAVVDLWNQNKPRAIDHIRRAIAELETAGDIRLALRARVDLAQQEGNENVPDKVFLESLEQARTMPDSESLQGMILRGWANLERRHGHMDLAMEHAQRAVALFAACQCDQRDWGYTEVSIGLIESIQGRHEAAIDHYRSALRLYAPVNDHAESPQALNNIGLEYASLHVPQRSASYYRQGLAAARAAHSTYYEHISAMSLAETYIALKDWPHAIALEQQVAGWAQTDRVRCIANSDLMWALLEAHQPAEAQKALDAARPSCSTVKDQAMIAYLDQSEAKIQLGNGQLTAALQSIQEAEISVEEARAHLVPEDAHKLGYNERSIEIYNSLIAILTRMNRPDEALVAAEQARARAFLDLLSSAHNKQSAVELTNPHSGIPEAFRGNLLASESHASPPTIAEIGATTKRLHSTLLSYWIADDTVYIWVARPDYPVFEATTRITGARLDAMVRAASPFAPAHPSPARLATRGGGSLTLDSPDRAAWRALYKVLIAPVEAQLPHEDGSLLTIVPSGPLFQLAFAALLDAHDHYLIEQYALHTVPSTGLLQFTEKSDQAARSLPTHFLFIANPAHFPFAPGGLRLPPLPGTDAEVRGVARLLPASSVTLLEGERAGVRDMMTGLPHATVLHFATHAIVSDKDPFSSFLALDRDQNGGELTTASIYGLHLHTSLVVLSACRTGLGHITGDGVAGLSRAFFYAGSASVITTLWDVADGPTARLLPRFYLALNEGQSRSAALRSAQLSLLHDLRHGKVQVDTFAGKATLPENPAFWAAFSLAGEP